MAEGGSQEKSVHGGEASIAADSELSDDKSSEQGPSGEETAAAGGSLPADFTGNPSDASLRPYARCQAASNGSGGQLCTIGSLRKTGSSYFCNV